MKVLRILVLLTIVSCANSVEPMGQWESELAADLDASHIELIHTKSTTTSNGRLESSENYLQLIIKDSKKLNEIKHNERLLKERCNEIRKMILTSTVVEASPAFNEFRITIGETHGFWIFKKQETTTLTYSVGSEEL